MADVRALLKAKRQEARIAHPFAAYSPFGQLKCIVCGTSIKHNSAWDGHLGSKIHRINVMHLKEEERLQDLKIEQDREEEAARGKRKVDNSEQPEVEPKKRKVSEGSNAFPADFFSDSSRAPIPMHSDESEDEQGAPSTAQVQPPSSAIDQEYERFQRELLDVPDQRETYDRATVFSEPVLASETPEGFPVNVNDDNIPVADTRVDDKKLKDEEERELILDRLLDEERAQEEADMKANQIKIRVEALKAKRKAAREKLKI